MIRWLYEWLGKYLGEQYSTLPVISEEVLREAEKLVNQYIDSTVMSGEYKRDRVYKALARMFQQVPRQHLSLAIELAYWKLHEC